MDEKKQRPLSVLVVDDDASMRLMMSDTLQQMDLSVAESENGGKAVALFNDLQPDMVLLDVNMPVMDGFSVCKEIRKSPGGQYIPIMMVTGCDDVESITKAYELGATDFVTKPINWDLLGHRVRYLLRSSETRIDLLNSQSQLLNAKKVAQISDWSWDVRKSKLYWSSELCNLIGIADSLKIKVHKKILDYVHEDDKPMVSRAVDLLFQECHPYVLEYRVVRADSTELHVYEQTQVLYDDNNFPTRILGTIQDVSKRKAAEQEIKNLAYCDDLTGLPNRAAFIKRIDLILSGAKRNKEQVAILFLDLDNFKWINDTLGHKIGDQLLKTVSERLARCLRESDYVSRNAFDEQGELMQPVARVGGDEFIILLNDQVTPNNVTKISQRILDVIAQPVQLAGNELSVYASLGIVIYPDDGEDTETLLKNADSVMYHAKYLGKNNFCFYDKKINEEAIQRIEIEQDLQKAIANDECFLLFQPKVEINNNQVVGVEALIRWDHPKKGLMEADKFISIAEESNLITLIDKWVLKKACQQNKKWLDHGYDISIAVNLSARQFANKGFIEDIKEVLAETKLQAKNLIIELTEGVLMQDDQQTINILCALKEIGVKVQVDDFGTGYSSLRYLSRFPLDTVKIDRSFVENLPEDEDDATIVKAIISLAHGLNLSVIVEGVENEQQLQFLIANQCDQIQGFYVSRPIDADEIENFLQAAMKKSA